MIHELTVAWRNLLKYKLQTAVCVCGLAVGFICFALSLLWVRHETTFNHFHPDAERLYMCCTEWDIGGFDAAPSAETRLVPQLNRDFPEIERATAYVNYGETRIEEPELTDRISRLAGVTQVHPDEHGMLCANGFAPMNIHWDSQPKDTKSLRVNHITTRQEWMDFWHIRLLKGHCPTAAEARQGQAMINETAIRAMGWNPEEAIGKRLYYADHVLTVAAAVAFPLGYITVRRWQEQYIEQLSAGWCIYLLLFLAMTAVVTACVGGQVWRAAQSRPTDMLEKE